ncbi:MAG: GDP-mannose 4,6-dehydratase [Caulobacteraceae bacterium]
MARAFIGADRLDESALLQPVNPYAASKASADILVRQAAAAGLAATVCRPFNHTGPGQSDAFVAPNFAAQIARIEAGLQAPVIEVGSLDEERDFLDVEDVVDAYRMLMELRADPAARGIFNVASGAPIRIGDILERLLSRSKLRIEVRVDRERLRTTPIPRVVGNAARAQGSRLAADAFAGRHPGGGSGTIADGWRRPGRSPWGAGGHGRKVATKEVDVKVTRGERVSASLAESADDIRLLKAELSAAQATIQGLRRRIFELKTSEQSLRALQREHSLLEARYQGRRARRRLLFHQPVLETDRPAALGQQRLAARPARRPGLGQPASRYSPPADRRPPGDDLRPRNGPAAGRGAAGAGSCGHARGRPKVRDPLRTRRRGPRHGRGRRGSPGRPRFAKALQDVGHTVRYVKWDQIRESCVFINIEERARLARSNGPPLTSEEAAIYPATGAPTTPVRPPPNSDSWLYVAEFPLRAPPIR